MTSWLALTKKEIRLGMPAFLLPIIVFIIGIGVASYFGTRNGFGIEAFVGTAIFATAIQVLYLPYYMFYSLQSERKKLHLWLHNPLPGAALITAKMVAGLLSMLVTLAITGTTALITLSLLKVVPFELSAERIMKMVPFLGVHLVLLSISIAIGFTFFWMIFLMLTRTIGTFVSFLSTFILFVATTSLYGWFESTWLYEKMTAWGEINISGMLNDFSWSVAVSQTDTLAEVGDISLFVGNYMFETIIAVVLFFAACWILDRKVEV